MHSLTQICTVDFYSRTRSWISCFAILKILKYTHKLRIELPVAKFHETSKYEFTSFPQSVRGEGEGGFRKGSVRGNLTAFKRAGVMAKKCRFFPPPLSLSLPRQSELS